MLEILPWSQINAPDDKGSAGRDNKQCNSKNPPMHARSTFAQTVAETANSFDRVAGLAQFLPQSTHMSINGTGVDYTFVTPDIAEQAIAFLNAAAALHQRAKQFEFDAGEMHDLAIDQNLMAQSVDVDRTGDK